MMFISDLLLVVMLLQFFISLAITEHGEASYYDYPQTFVQH